MLVNLLVNYDFKLQSQQGKAGLEVKRPSSWKVFEYSSSTQWVTSCSGNGHLDRKGRVGLLALRKDARVGWSEIFCYTLDFKRINVYGENIFQVNLMSDL